ncbi:homoserine kinase [Agrilactobacillus fermenti]|uniref:homoserine kinase n=1 Tax=Agrilactobacillus fermenti TaxID=2586909 RepID=UPI001E283175|nr:homoserine kinase [Agrilactobacillus fermenti]MCD2255402.1 homoserine kinase [Agrilactobacillus fermenti]
MKIQVPATTANLGAGIDSCGLALSLYLTVTVGPETVEWQVKHNLSASIPTDYTNIMVETIRQIAPDVMPHLLIVHSDIPTERGLGSSTAAIVAGVELASRLGDLNLSMTEKIAQASSFEDHPDNVAAAFRGNFVITAMVKQRVYSVRHLFPEAAIIVHVPNHKLTSYESRNALPKTIAYDQAITGSAISNVMIAAIISGDLKLAGPMMELDTLQETYRDQFVPELEAKRFVAKQNGAYATLISGAGPALITIAPETSRQAIKAALQQQWPEDTYLDLSVDKDGLQVF